VQLNISDREKALKFKKYVDKYAQIYNISPELIYAIIHTESYFNPMATSPAPAYGLMQIMPTNAGKDAAKVLYGTPILFLPAFYMILIIISMWELFILICCVTIT